jgi:phosphoglycerol transferase MdoB-like AlkP superfamily enzyme
MRRIFLATNLPMNYKNPFTSYLSRKYPHILIILRLYLVSILTFFLFRLTLFFTQYHRVIDSVSLPDILKSFLMGVRFDVVISGYILILPYLVFTALFMIRRKFHVVYEVIFFYTFILLTLGFTVAAADIPYFNQFYSRFSITAFEWISSPAFVFKMIIQEPLYWMVVIPLLIVTYLLFRILRYFWRQLEHVETIHSNLLLKSIVSILFLGLIFIGIRGRTEIKSPIRVGTAYFSNNAFLNQLGLNPNFTLIRSYLDSQKEQNKSIVLMDNSAAIHNVREFMHISPVNNEYPLARIVSFDTSKPLKYNVVLVIMESMSANKMTRHGNSKNLTPFLDNLSHKGLYFENIFTAGIHTFNGVFSTLFSYPALFRQHPMKESSMLKYNGLPSELKKSGYSTIYFTTHDGQFDNVEGFLLNNDVEKVISKPNYPQEMVKTTLGVPDDYMFEFSIPILNTLAEKRKPFLATFMTASDHGPFYIPDYFKPRSTGIEDQIVEYADWSLEKFVNLCSAQKWFSNTIFVFIADHGAPIDGTYEMPVSYYHTPLIFYCPAIFKEAKTNSTIGGQIDVFPTLMGVLHQPYINNSLGIDLLNDKRPFIYVNGDDKYGVFDRDWLLIVHNDKSMGLFKYSLHDTHNYLPEFPGIAKQMKLYAESNLQVAQFNISHGKQFYSN